MPRTGNCTTSSCAARRKGRKQPMDRISLWYCEGASDKIYQAEIVPVSEGFQVNFAYGRRGSTMNTGTKTSTPVPYAQAKKVFDTLVKAKLAKGHRSEEHTSELQSPCNLVCRLLLEINKMQLEVELYNHYGELSDKKFKNGFNQNTPHLYFFNDTATTEIYTLSLHDALPIS